MNFSKIYSLARAGDANKLLELISQKDHLWRSSVSDIPEIIFPQNWAVKVIPPYTFADARFIVRDISGEATVSIYLDLENSLGCCFDSNGYAIPYYEIYPAQDGDTERFLLTETEDMIKSIQASLDRQNAEKESAEIG